MPNGRTRGIWPAVITAAAFATACGRQTNTVVEAPTNTTPTTVEPEQTTAPSPATAPRASAGTLTVTLATTGSLSSDQLTTAILGLQQRSAILGYPADVVAIDEERLQITVHRVAAADRNSLADALAERTEVYLRPVLTDDQFNRPCVTSAPDDAEPAASTPGVAGDTPSTTVPVAAADQPGYVPAVGGGFCRLGPAAGSGAVFATDAHAELLNGSRWGVAVSLLPGAAGEDVWNALAEECFKGTAICPTHQLAIEVDAVVVSAPTIQQAEFHGEVHISGPLTTAQAGALAQLINRGTLPYMLTVEAVQYVSP